MVGGNKKEDIMPIYEFKCKKCDKVYELKRKVGHDIAICPVCKHIMDKLISASNFRLKGKGWARDGYSYGKE